MFLSNFVFGEVAVRNYSVNTVLLFPTAITAVLSVNVAIIFFPSCSIS